MDSETQCRVCNDEAADAGLGLLRFQTHEWSERVDYLRQVLREVKP